MNSINQEIESITGQIANSFAQQLDEHLGYFLKKNMIPFNGDINETNDKLRSMGMRLISEHSDDDYMDMTTTYMLVKIIDSTSFNIKCKLGIGKE